MSDLHHEVRSVAQVYDRALASLMISFKISTGKSRRLSAPFLVTAAHSSSLSPRSFDMICLVSRQFRSASALFSSFGAAQRSILENDSRSDHLSKLENIRERWAMVYEIGSLRQ
jgi:hypothetical protein